MILELDGDGIVFHGFKFGYNMIPDIVCEFTKDSIVGVTMFPRCCYSIYKIVDGKRVYVRGMMADGEE